MLAHFRGGDSPHSPTNHASSSATFPLCVGACKCPPLSQSRMCMSYIHIPTMHVTSPNVNKKKILHSHNLFSYLFLDFSYNVQHTFYHYNNHNPLLHSHHLYYKYNLAIFMLWLHTFLFFSSS